MSTARAAQGTLSDTTRPYHDGASSPNLLRETALHDAGQTTKLVRTAHHGWETWRRTRRWMSP